MKAKVEWAVVLVLGAVAATLYVARPDADPQHSAETGVQMPQLQLGDADGPSPWLEGVKAEAELPELASRSLSDGLPTRGLWRGKPTAADVNEDGHLDLVTSIRRWDSATVGEGLYVYLGDGAGKWSPSVDGLRRDMGYGGAATGDIDRDGNLDIAFSGHDVTPHLFLGDGAGKWRQPAAQPIIPEMCSDVALGDPDVDGDLDLVALGFWPKRGGLWYFPGAGDGTLGEMADLLPERFGMNVDFADVFGDERPDLLVTTDAGVKVLELVDGVWTDKSAGLPMPSVGGAILGVVPVDLDGDGVQELVSCGMCFKDHVPLTVHRWGDGEWVATGRGLPNDEAYFDMTLAQLDGTGLPEIVLAGRLGLTVIRFTGPDSLERVGRVSNTEGVTHTAAGDFDGDGRDEVVYVGRDGVRVLSIELPVGGA